MAPTLVVAQDLVLAMDYGQFLLRGGVPEFYSDDLALLSEAQNSGEGVAATGTSVLVRSPHQNNSAMPFRVEVWDQAPGFDLDDWDEAFEANLLVDAHATLLFESPTLPGTGCGVPPGRYRALITGRGIVAHGWPGSTTPGDSWRLRLWPTDGERAARRLRSWNTPWTPRDPTPSVAVDSQAWKGRLHDELLSLTPGDVCCRRAEAAALLRLTHGAPAGALAIRRLDALFPGRANDPDLPTEVGVVNTAGAPITGLPPRVVAAGPCCAAAVWRGALLANGRLVAMGSRLHVAVSCPNPATALGLVGAARRIGVTDVTGRETPDRVLVDDAPTLLETLGASTTAAAWRAAAVEAKPNG